jgi:predicted phage terminase large subunit-like protein
MELRLANRPNYGEKKRKQEYLVAFSKLKKIKNRVIHDLIAYDARVDVLADLCGYDYNDYHEVLIDHQDENNSTIQLGPRGSGKTTIGTVLSSCTKLIGDRNRRILYGSETISQAQTFLSEAKSVLIHPNVVEVFGNLKGDIWNEDEITIAGRTINRKEKSIMTTGADSAITGMHFDDIYVDDLVTLRNSRTEYQRRKVREWFYMTLLPCITDAFTCFRVLGTRYHPEDLYNDFLVNDKRFRDSAQIIPAMIPGTDRSNCESIWSTEWLLGLLESMTRALFDAQYNQNASGVKGTVFDDRFFRYCKNFPQRLAVFTGVDLAIGKKKRNAKFAIVTIGIDRRTLKVYLLDYHTEKLSLKAQDDLIDRHNETWGPIAVGIEANAFQASKIQTLKENKKTRNVPAIPIYTDKDKETRAEKLAHRYEIGEIVHHESEKGGEYETQLMNFPDGKYKDLIDAIDIAIRTAFRKKKKKRSKSKEPGLIRPGMQKPWRN